MKRHYSNTVSAFDAKTHFASLLEKVGKGEKITILKHNFPAAMLVPVASKSQNSVSKIIEEIYHFPKGKKTGRAKHKRVD